MQSLEPETGKNQSNSTVPVLGITLSESWRSAFGKLSAGCLSDARAVILIGERGVGKASLIEAWREQSASAFHIVTLEDAVGEPDQVVANLAHLMGVDTADLGRGAILSAITASVQENRAAGKETVVIVDNADEVPANTVELLMILARDRGSNKPLLRYILSGTQKLRKTLRLDGGTARRQNYLTIELARFTPQQTKAFVLANLSRGSNVTIADDAVEYLHESTSGKPANILTVLDKVRQGRMSEGETEITKAHIQSLVKAPSRNGASSKNPQSGPDIALVNTDDSAPVGSDVSLGGEIVDAQNEDAQKNFAEPGNVFATNSDLPNSIRDVNDPRPLLRWAFGLDEHSETEALASRAEEAAAAARTESAKGSNTKTELNAALAQVAERERAERNPPPPPAPAPVNSSSKEGTLDHMIQGEAFAFDKPSNSTLRATKSPHELNMAIREAPPEPSRRKNKVVLAAGVAVLGIAALGMLWSSLQPGDLTDPTGSGTSSEQTAAVTPEATASEEGEATTVASSSAGTGEPDLASVIAIMKSPDLANSDNGPADSIQPFNDDAPRVVNIGYLSPSRLNSTSDTIGLRQAIMADMAASERIELAGEEKRLMTQLASLEEQVVQKQSVLSSLERAVTALSEQARESGDLIDNRNAEIEVVTSRLAFMARDSAQAAERLASASAESQTAESRLQAMRDELAAAEELILENKQLLDQNQTNTANLGAAVAKREAEFAELTRKVEGAEALLATRRAELSAVLVQQEEAQSVLAELQGQLEDNKATQEIVEAELAQLRSDRDAQSTAALSLKAEVTDADARLAKANAELETATSALAERTATLASIEARSTRAQSELDALVAKLESRESVVTTSNQEVDTLTTQRDSLEAELQEKAAKIEIANSQLANLEANQQTASAEFEALSSRRETLQADVETGEVVLETLTEKLNVRQAAVEALVIELNAGAVQIAEQKKQLEQLKAESETVVAAQSDAQSVVTEGQGEVATASVALEELKAQQVQTAAALEEIETLTVASQAEFDAIQLKKSDAEREIAATIQRLNDIKAQEVAAEAGFDGTSSDLEAKNVELAALDERISTSNLELEAVISKKAALNDQLTELTDAGTAKLREQQSQLDQIELRLMQKQDALAALTQELDAAQAESQVVASVDRDALETATVPAIRVRPAVASQESVSTEDAPAGDAGLALAPRDADLVQNALIDAPGLGRAPQDKKDQLQAALVRGECVTDALKQTFGRVNPHTLVALLETMEMCGS